MEGNVANTRRSNENEFNLKEWHLKARISKENHNTSSRRFSASYIRSFREDSSRSFRSNFTISSTASSPGYPLKDEIDPSTYSFTTALKALQGRSGYVWECLSPEGFALNSKWNEAERYICNPYSGEVPMECLSSKTLNGRSFRSYMASRVTMSAPLVYSVHHPRTTRNHNHNHNHNNNQISKLDNEQIVHPQSLFQGNRTRDVGIQSRLAPPPSPPTPPPPEGSLSSPSAISTPSIRERSINRCEDTEDQDEDVQNSSSSVRSNVVEEVKVKVTREKEDTKRKSKEGLQKKKRYKTRQLCVCKQISGCNLISSWKNLLMKRSQKDKTISPQI